MTDASCNDDDNNQPIPLRSLPLTLLALLLYSEDISRRKISIRVMSYLSRTVWAGAKYPPRNVIINRNFSRTFPRSEKPSEPVTKPDVSVRIVTHTVKPYQKYALVWAGTYKSIADIPDRVSHGVLDAALNKARVKIAIYMMIATALMAGAAVYSGKKAAQKGDSLALRGMEYHKQLREQAANEREAAATKSAQ